MVSYGATLAAVVLAVMAIMYVLPKGLEPITSNIMAELKFVCAFSLLSSVLASAGFWLCPEKPRSSPGIKTTAAEVLLHLSMLLFLVSLIVLIFLVFLLPFPITTTSARLDLTFGA
jgi:hypothetical protein